MARVIVKRVLRGQGKTVQLKTFPKIAPLLMLGAREATATHLRILAEEARQLLVDKIYAGSPQAPGRIVLSSPGFFKRRDIDGDERRPFPRLRALSWPHVLRKLRLGQDGRKLLATGDYVKNIEVVKSRGQTAAIPSWLVRMKPKAHTPLSGGGFIQLSLLARVLEFGSRRHKIPPRPHWRPTAQLMLARFKRLPRAVGAEALRSALRRVV